MAIGATMESFKGGEEDDEDASKSSQKSSRWVGMKVESSLQKLPKILNPKLSHVGEEPIFIAHEKSPNSQILGDFSGARK